MINVFVDSGAFVALLFEPDRYHDRAESIYSDLVTADSRLVTTNHVLAETANWLAHNRSAGYRNAMQFRTFMRHWTPISADQIGEGMPRGTGLLVVYSTPGIERSAWDILRKYDTAGFSFTDCVSFAVMQALGITRAFAFDAHFDAAGFERL